MKILNFGSLNMDYVYQVDHIASPGETIRSSNFQIFAGGKGLNQSIALARAGAHVCHAGNVGQDGEMLLELCAKNGIGTKHMRRVPGRTGHAIIQVDRDGQNCIVVFGGSNQSNTKDYVDEVLADFGEGDMLLMQNEINLLDYIIERAYQKRMHIALNPSPVDGNLLQYDLSKVSTFILNEVEGAQITGDKEPAGILAEMKSLYPKAAVVLTLGVQGVVYQYKDHMHTHGIYRVDVVDTTAAGDTFTGYFLALISQNHPVEQALGLASKASAIAVSRKGATDSIPLLKDVNEAKMDLTYGGITYRSDHK